MNPKIMSKCITVIRNILFENPDYVGKHIWKLAVESIKSYTQGKILGLAGGQLLAGLAGWLAGGLDWLVGW